MKASLSVTFVTILSLSLFCLIRRVIWFVPKKLNGYFCFYKKNDRSIVSGFESSCFLANVREKSMRDGGLVELQNTLLFEILGEHRLTVNNVDKGINVIKKMLSRERVLVVLDDVNHLDQLKKLVGGVDWFGMGSRIIITTRDKHLLTAHQINLIYKVEELNYDEATVLFSWNAFGRNRHQVDKLIVHTAVQYVQGLPLALIVLGSCLCGRSTDRSIDYFYKT